MKVVLVSNILSAHNLPLCEAIIEQVEEFWFIATKNSETEGFQVAKEETYILRYWNETEKNISEEQVIDADIVIFGDGPKELLEIRMKTNKLTFLYSERFFKLGIWRRFIPFTYKKIMDKVLKYKNRNLYILCASAYLTYDLFLLKFPVEKCYKWGYFPEIKQQNIERLLINKDKKEKIVILWAGRFLKWKHPDLAIELAEKLKENGYSFELQLIGCGELERDLSQMICEKKLDGCVKILGYMPTELVREHMEKADIYLFTSDFQEGWGAVLNEAMNGACAIVASHAIGAVPFLLTSGENGFIYRNEDIDDLYQKVKILIEDPSMREKIGIAAYETVCKEWNAKIAIQRLLIVSEQIINGRYCPQIYEQGVCSLAEKIENNWIENSKR